MTNRRVAFRCTARAALLVVPLEEARFAVLARGFAARERPGWRERAGRAGAFAPPPRLPGAGRLRPRRTRDPDAAAWLGWLAHRLDRAREGGASAGPDREIARVGEAVARDAARAAGGAPRRCPAPHDALPGGADDAGDGADATHRVDAELDVELSSAGLRYPAAAGLPPDSPVACALGLPGAERAIGALARTVREPVPIAPGRPETGVLVALRFVHVDEVDRDAVARHVMACQRAALRAPGAPARGATLRA